jgi:DNA-nicking Smr family endonuclease
MASRDVMTDDDELFVAEMAGLGLGAAARHARDDEDALFEAEMGEKDAAPDQVETAQTAPVPPRRSGPLETATEAGHVFEEAMGALGLGEEAGPTSAPLREEAPPPQARPPRPPGESDTAASKAFETAMAQLEDVPVRGQEGGPVTPAPDPTTGAPDVLRRRVRKGLLRHESELDLHGMTQAQAREAVSSYLSNSAAQGTRVTRIICGRGLHSKEGSMLLRDSLPAWLQSDFAELVETAFRAPPEEGGEGAWYAILRR